MDYIISKGMAGLGNRLQSLGWSIDLVLKHKVPLVVDWNDSTWQLGVDSYFHIDGIEIHSPDEVPEPATVWPDCWQGRLHEDYCPNSMRRTCKQVDMAANLVVVCRYRTTHSDEIYKRFRPTPAILTGLVRNAPPGDYNAWHIRHTDKLTYDWKEWLDRAKDSRNTTGMESVVLTDSIPVQEAALKMGLRCPSCLVSPDRSRGVHHAKVNASTKHRLNSSAIIDMLIAVHAKQFTACCPDSSFSLFVERMRNVNQQKGRS